MTIFRLNFLLKVGQMKVCQNPSFISTAIDTIRMLFVIPGKKIVKLRSVLSGFIHEFPVFELGT